MPGIISTHTRDSWGDRNPLQAMIRYRGDSVAPHVATERAKYTVPTGKKAQVQNYYTLIHVLTAATTAGVRYILCGFVPLGGTIGHLMVAQLNADKNVIGNVNSGSVGLSTTLLVGDYVVINTYDGSTAGTVDYNGSITITEYNA